ncbi:hypothetical protein TNCV_17971 [Trichonephila clavipes]|nr:hypothetical protein TNCV_17971 [Trichonephila clavipes]
MAPNFTTVNAATYGASFLKMRMDIKNHWHGVLFGAVFILHDNALPNVAVVGQTLLSQFHWEALKHPPHSSDLSLGSSRKP